MTEYIERAALKQELAPYEENDFSQQMDVILAIVDAQSTADVVEVRHGRWIPEACESVSKRNRLIEYKVYSCSICGRSNGRVKKRYCPNCGALMDKEADHD